MGPSHLGARPEHATWQGKVYSRTGKGYPDFKISTRYGDVDGLCGANCRHNFGPYFEGQENPFEQYDSGENKKQYEMEQRQRTLERRIRDTKRKTMNWKTAMDSATDNAQKAEFEAKHQRKAALLQKQNAAYNDFCEENGLNKRSDRISIAKWDRSQAAKARAAAARKYNSGVDISANGGKLNAGIQFFAKSSKDFETVFLPKKEYAHVMSEIATNISETQKGMSVFRKPIGKYIYTVENGGFGEYRIIGKQLIRDETYAIWEKLHDKN